MHKFKIKDKKQFAITLAIVLSMILAIILLISTSMQDKTVKNSHTSNAAGGKYNDQKKENAEKKGIYINDYELGIKLFLPSDWDGSYTREKGDKSISFYHSKLYEQNKKGLLFTVYVDKTSNIDPKKRPYSKLENFHTLSTKNGKSLCISYPSSCDNVNGTIKKKLTSMMDDVKHVISDTIEFVN